MSEKKDLNLPEGVDWADFVPEDLLKEIEEAERELRGKGSRPRKPYPSSRDVVEAVAEAARMCRGARPDEFPELVRKLLEERGFDVRHVTDKRIWRTYENLVRRGFLPDTLRVVGYYGVEP